MKRHIIKSVLLLIFGLVIGLNSFSASDTSQVIYRGDGFKYERAKNPYIESENKPKPEDRSVVNEQSSSSSSTASPASSTQEKTSASKEKSKSKASTKTKSRSKTLKPSPPEPEVDSEAITDDNEEDGVSIWSSIKNWFKGIHVPWYVKLIIGLIVWYVLRLFYLSFLDRCPRCKKWNAMRVVSEVVIDERPSSIVENRKISFGDTTGHYQQSVPATAYQIEVTRRCVCCDHEIVTIERRVIKN